MSVRSRFSRPSSVGHRDAHDLFGRRHSVDDLSYSAGSESAHPVLDRGNLEVRRRRAGENLFLEIVGEAHDLVKGDATLVPAAVARTAAGSLLKLGRPDL